MNIKKELAQEAVNKYDDMRDAECYYEKALKFYVNKARESYKTLCRYFNGGENRTGQCVVSEEHCIEVLGLDSFEGARVIRMMYEIKITERQNGGMVI